VRLIRAGGALETVEQVWQFIEIRQVVEFEGLLTMEKYCWTEEALMRFEYHLLTRDKKEVI